MADRPINLSSRYVPRPFGGADAPGTPRDQRIDHALLRAAEIADMLPRAARVFAAAFMAERAAKRRDPPAAS